MAITPVRLTVKSPFQRDGHAIDAADYAGREISRPDVNSSGGLKTTYLLNAVVPVRQDTAISNMGLELDVTDLVDSGQIEVL